MAPGGLNSTLLCLGPPRVALTVLGVRSWEQPGVFLPEQQGPESEETVWGHPPPVSAGVRESSGFPPRAQELGAGVYDY